MRYLTLLLFIFLISCGPLNTINTNNNDGIYVSNDDFSNNNSSFYKNYFEQKSNELGINSSVNDTIVTDINNYSSNTNISYSNSNGSWGDNPSSVNIIFRDRYVYSPYMYNYDYGYNWYNNYYPYYNPYSYWNWNRINHSPWGFNFPGYGYGYGYTNRYGYGMWNNWWHPYYNYPMSNGNIYERNKYSNIAYMKGKRGSSIYKDKNTLVKSTNNYNIGRSKEDVKSETKDQSKKSDEIKSRNINRVYYALKNSRNNVTPARDYQNRGETESFNNPKNINKNRSSNSNFQATKYGVKTRSYDVSRSSKVRNYSRTELNNKNSNSKVRNYSRVINNSNSSGSTRSRPKYTPSSSNSSRSSAGTRSTSGSSSSSRSGSRGVR